MHVRGWWMTLALLWACDCGGEGAAPDPRSGESQPAASTEAAQSTPSGEPSGPPEPVRLTTADGVHIAGTLRRAADEGAPAVILVHGLSADRAQVAPLVESLAHPPGMTTLAIDMRGHGESTAGPDDTSLAWQRFETADWEAVASDVRAAIDYLVEESGLAPSGIGLVGASMGSSAAIRAAAEDERVDAVVAISPGRAYRGVDAIIPVDSFGERVALLAIAAEGEAPAAETARNIARIARRGALRLYPGEAHGLALADSSPEMLQRVRAFLAEQLGG